MVELQPNMPDLSTLANEQVTIYEVSEEDIKDIKVEIHMEEDPLVSGDGSSPEGNAIEIRFNSILNQIDRCSSLHILVWLNNCYNNLKVI